MEQHTPEYDYRRYDRIWQRVAPTLEPYPQAQVREDASAEPAAQGAAPSPAPSAALTPTQLRQESRLPGAEMNPCCMGTAAQEMLEVLTGYIEDELCDRRYYLALLHCAPVWARQSLRTIADDEGSHAKRLMAVYYLITGECYRPAIACGHITIDRWCPALRERYHTEACGGMNYARSADGTTDVCLANILRQLSEDEYRHAGMISAMLERSLQY